MENVGMKASFWRGRRVFLTGHTGFKGSWLSIWLSQLGAQVHGFALDPNTDPNLFDLCQIGAIINDRRGDIRDRAAIKNAIDICQPEIIIHMAAQPLVRLSYAEPIETFETNIMGTANLLESVRNTSSVRAVVVVTTDKCYENLESANGYRETDPLGGYDPYSSSKAGAEIVTSAYRSSFFNPEDYKNHQVAIATARAGNVIGGGDWSAERLIPDLVRALMRGETLTIRNPKSARPWQHVLEPLHGYLLLAQKLVEDGPRFSGAWNFGPDQQDHITVEEIIDLLQAELKKSVPIKTSQEPQLHETNLLRLDSSKAREHLDWKPKFSIRDSLEWTAYWVREYLDGAAMNAITRQQINAYSARSFR